MTNNTKVNKDDAVKRKPNKIQEFLKENEHKQKSSYVRYHTTVKKKWR